MLNICWIGQNNKRSRKEEVHLKKWTNYTKNDFRDRLDTKLHEAQGHQGINEKSVTIKGAVTELIFKMLWLTVRKKKNGCFDLDWFRLAIQEWNEPHKRYA